MAEPNTKFIGAVIESCGHPVYEGKDATAKIKSTAATLEKEIEADIKANPKNVCTNGFESFRIIGDDNYIRVEPRQKPERCYIFTVNFTCRDISEMKDNLSEHKIPMPSSATPANLPASKPVK